MKAWYTLDCGPNEGLVYLFVLTTYFQSRMRYQLLVELFIFISEIMVKQYYYTAKQTKPKKFTNIVIPLVVSASALTWFIRYKFMSMCTYVSHL